MSSKKRFIILIAITAVMIIITLSIISLIAINDSDFSKVTKIAYALIIPIYIFIIGLATRLLSSKIKFLLFSLTICFAVLVGSIFMIGSIYDLNLGMHNIGFQYYVMSLIYFFIPYCCILSLKTYKRKRIIKKRVDEIIQNNCNPKNIDTAYFVKAYNKETDRKETYLVWNKHNKWYSSDEVIYYDYVELIVADIKNKVYVIAEPPRNMKLAEYIKKQK